MNDSKITEKTTLAESDIFSIDQPYNPNRTFWVRRMTEEEFMQVVSLPQKYYNAITLVLNRCREKCILYPDIYRRCLENALANL